MIHKRFFVDEELYTVSTKHPRLMEVPSLEFLPSDSALQQPFTLGESGFTIDTSEGVEKVGYEAIAKHSGSSDESDASVPGCLYISSSWTSDTGFEDARPATGVHSYIYPEDPSSNHLMKTTSLQSGDIYSLLLAHSPRKSVPIGSDHQANIPSNSPNVEGSDSVAASRNDDDEIKFMGTSILPMPGPHASCDAECDEIACKCEDSGSARCIKQHVAEARETLRKSLGQERFVGLGLGCLGEEVAAKWKGDEEKLFREIVFSNPASSGNNFWDNLGIVFPSREKKEIVSYYFNVFILRKRSEQNRFDPANVDSDDDEWHDYYNDGEDDYVAESPIFEDDPSLDRDFMGPSLRKEGDDDHGFRDDSCATFDLGAAKAKAGKDGNRDQSGHGSHCFHNVGGHEFILGPCDSRDWDAEHISCLRNEVEFLPTCSMIKEVFGEALK